MSRHSLFASFFLWAILCGATANAFVLAIDSSGNITKWPAPAKPVFYANWNNSKLLSYGQIFTAFTNSLQRWKTAGSANIDFDYYQTGTSPTRTALDGENAVFFSSQSSQKLGGGTIGVTYVYSNKGAILETDVEFNDDTFTFTTNPTDSSMFGDGKHIFLENVSTHEFGHAFGLAHSAALEATMVYLEDRGQSHPSCDDLEAMAAMYPLPSFVAGRGSLSGTVVIGAVAPTDVFGANVVAISKTRGTVIASAITQSDGTFSIPNLEPGDYYLMIEPFDGTAPLTALCAGNSAGCFYGTVNSATVCGGFPFKRAFIEGGLGLPTKFTVNSGINTAVPVVTVGCAAMGNPLYPTSTAGLSAVITGAVPSSYVARGLFGALGSSQYFMLHNVSGNIAVKALAYGLYSPVDAKVSILDGGGVNSAPGTTVQDNDFFDTSDFINFDSTANISAAPMGDYIIKVTYNGDLSTTTNAYPAGVVQYPSGTYASQVDVMKYYLLIVTVNDATTLLPVLANNARCETADSFSAFPDKGSGPPTSSGDASQGGPAASGSGGGCGTIENQNDAGLNAHAVTSAWGVLLLLFIARVGARALQQLARRRNAR